jgi:hypothetical protein
VSGVYASAAVRVNALPLGSSGIVMRLQLYDSMGAPIGGPSMTPSTVCGWVMTGVSIGTILPGDYAILTFFTGVLGPGDVVDVDIDDISVGQL